MDDTNYISEDMRLSVKRGAYWLDENYPGWEARLDLSTLNMNSCNSCVIGQAVGDYHETLSRITRSSDFTSWDEVGWAIEHGFNIEWTSLNGGSAKKYRKLETVWTKEVLRRLGGSVA